MLDETLGHLLVLESRDPGPKGLHALSLWGSCDTFDFSLFFLVVTLNGVFSWPEFCFLLTWPPLTFTFSLYLL